MSAMGKNKAEKYIGRLEVAILQTMIKEIIAFE